MNKDDSLIDALVADLRPVRTLRVRKGWAMLASTLLIALLGIHAVFGLRPLEERLAGSAWFFLGEAVLFAIGLGCAFAAIHMASPAYSARPIVLRSLTAATVLPLLVVAGIVALPSLATPARLTQVHSHWTCGALGILAGIFVALPLIHWVRQGAPASLKHAGLCIGGAGGALGSAVYALSCPLDGFEHWAIWHFAPVLACALLGRHLLPRLLKW